MLRNTITKHHNGPRDIRWRLHEPARIEAFSDAVFAFAVTLIVVSLEVPLTFHALLVSMKGFFGFSICFAMLMLIWYEQYLFFRRYGVQDLKTIFYNCALLFIVLFYVYPLKFLFGFLTLGNKSISHSGEVFNKFNHNYEISQLMIVYGAGFISIYIIFYLMDLNAYNKREKIGLNSLEQLNTITNMYSKLIRVAIGILSVIAAIIGVYGDPRFGMYAGLIYALIGPALGIFHSRRRKLVKEKFTSEEIEEVNQSLI